MSIEKIREEAKSGNVESIVKLARCYYLGIGVEKDAKLAYKYFDEAAKKDNAEAMSNLAYLYLKGIGVNQDEDKAATLYKQAAEKDDPIALYSYGLILKKGLYNRKVNLDKAKAMFEKAASLGNFAAKYEVALLQDDEAQKLLAAQDVMTKNKGIALSNKVEAAFKEAADKGHVPAMYALGVKYLQSKDSNKQKMAFDLFSTCAEKGVAAAHYALAYMYDIGLGIEKDYWQSFKHFKLAYDDGFKKAIFNIIYAYMTGLGVKRNYKKAIDLARDAVNDQQKEANYFAGLCFKFGFDVPRNIEKAKELFELAAQADFAPAVYQLGQLADPYYGIGKKEETAIEHYKVAATLGSQNAKAELARINFEKDKKLAFEQLKKAAEEESYIACEMLGEMFEEGKEIAKDMQKALTYYKQAADLGSVTSAQAVVRIAEAQNDKATVLKYKDKITIKKDAEEYLSAAKECREAKDFERAAFWYAMTAEYAEDDESVDRAKAALQKATKGPDGLWTLKQNK